MVKEIVLHSAEDLRQFMYLAMQSVEDIGVHTVEGKIADAKSILGLMALDYNKPGRARGPPFPETDRPLGGISEDSARSRILTGQPETQYTVRRTHRPHRPVGCACFILHSIVSKHAYGSALKKWTNR